VVGFRKEQVNANLLNGKGEIKDIQLNCSFLNEELRKVTPYLEFHSVHIASLSFRVTSWTNLRQAPIVVHIGKIDVVLHEPLHFSHCPNRPKLRQVTASEYAALVQSKVCPTPRTASYNVLDRILDNVTIEIEALCVTIGTLGAFKTQRRGPWTPPLVRLQLASLKLSNVDEYGTETNATSNSSTQSTTTTTTANHKPNGRTGRRNHRDHKSVWVYKKLECDYQISLVIPTTKDESDRVIPLVSSWPLSDSGDMGKNRQRRNHCRVLIVQVAYQRRLADAQVLRLSIDASLALVSVDVTSATVPLLVQWCVAVHHLLLKDRSSADPLRSTHNTNTAQTTTGTTPTPEGVVAAATAISDTTPATTAPAANLESTSEPTAEDVSTHALVTAESYDSTASFTSHPDTEEGSATSATNLSILETTPSLLDLALEEFSEEDDGSESVLFENVPSNNEVTVAMSETSLPVSEEPSSTVPATPLVQPATAATVTHNARPSSTNECPKLVFPNGIVIHEKLAVSFSIHGAIIRGLYADTQTPSTMTTTSQSEDTGYLEMTVEGVIAEAIWPTTTKVRRCIRRFL
jgi:hypothetical protein